MGDVFLVVDGTDLEYEVLAAFSSRELADEYVSDHNKSLDCEDEYGPFVVVVELDMPKSKWYIMIVTMARDGSISRVETRLGVKPNTRFVRDLREVCDCFEDVFLKPWVLIHGMVTPDVEQVIKSANEIRARTIALDMWGNNKFFDLV